MSLTSTEAAAKARAEQYNHSQYDASSNPFGMGGLGYKKAGADGLEGNFSQAARDVADLAGGVARMALEASDDAADAANQVTLAAAQVTLASNQVTLAAAQVTLAEGHADDSAASAAEALTYRNAAQAAASAADKGIDATTTAGTGAAYTADFTPNVTDGDGKLYALNIHATNTSTTPTLSIEGGPAYPLVIGYDRRPIPLGLLDAGRNIVITTDGTNNEYAIIGGLPLHELNRDIDARGFTIDSAVLDNSTVQNTRLVNCTGLGVREFAATGVIPATGDPAALNSDGTVSAVSGSVVAFAQDASPATGTPEVGQNDDGFYHAYADRVIFTKGGDSYVGVISGQEMTIGTADTIVASFSSNGGKIVEIPNTNNVLAVWADGATLKAKVGEINTSTNRITWGTAVNSAAFAEENERLFLNYDPVHDDFVVITQGNTATYNDDLYSCIVTVSGTTPSFSSISARATWPTSSHELIGAVYDRVQNKYAAFFGYQQNISNGTTSYTRDELLYQIFERTDATTWASVDEEQALNLNDLSFNLDLIVDAKTAFRADKKGNILLVGHGDQSTPLGFGFAAMKINGNSISLLSKLRLPKSGATGYDTSLLAYDEDSNVFGYAFFENSGGDVDYGFCHVTGDGLSIDTFTEISSGHASGNVFPAGSGKFALFTTGTTDRLYINQAPWTDSNADDWIGTCDGDSADSPTLKRINLRGAVDENQSGLTAGLRYYLKEDGSLTTIANGRYFGRALSSTSILLAAEEL